MLTDVKHEQRTNQMGGEKRAAGSFCCKIQKKRENLYLMFKLLLLFLVVVGNFKSICSLALLIHRSVQLFLLLPDNLL